MGPQNRDHSFNLNKKEKNLALKSALSNKLSEDKIIFIESLEIKNYKTKELNKTLKRFDFNSALFIHTDDEKNLNFKEFKKIEPSFFNQMKGSILIDTRGIIDPEDAKKAKLIFRGLGRGKL